MAAKATITECDDRGTAKPEATPIAVDFNPQSLRLTYGVLGPAGSQASDGSTKAQSRTQQHTGNSSDLSMELLFDTTRSGDDVRAKPLQLIDLATAGQAKAAKTVRFSWGTFLFVGVIQSLSETIDLFSDAGVPLRATVGLSVRGVAPPTPDEGSGGAGAGAGIGASASFGAGVSASAGASFSAGAGIPVGTTPLTLSQSGDSIQAMTARAGVRASWKQVAAANGIDNPRVLPPGTVLSLRVKGP